MFVLTKASYEAKMAKIKEHNIQREYRRMLWEERFRYWPRFKTPPTSKIALWAGFLLMLEIIIFCQYLALKTFDTAPIVAMVGAIGGWMSMFFSYNKKSAIENSRDGIVFETAMLNQGSESDSTEAVG